MYQTHIHVLFCHVSPCMVIFSLLPRSWLTCLWTLWGQDLVWGWGLFFWVCTHTTATQKTICGGTQSGWGTWPSPQAHSCQKQKPRAEREEGGKITLPLSASVAHPRPPTSQQGCQRVTPTELPLGLLLPCVWALSHAWEGVGWRGPPWPSQLLMFTAPYSLPGSYTSHISFDLSPLPLLEVSLTDV